MSEYKMSNYKISKYEENNYKMSNCKPSKYKIFNNEMSEFKMYNYKKKLNIRCTNSKCPVIMVSKEEAFSLKKVFFNVSF